MITYELAKKLKDVGFPQNSYDKNGTPVARLGRMSGNQDRINFQEEVIAPSLSELIEECGMGFETLHEDSFENWFAGIYNWYDHYWVTIETGKTPEEAVANLYIKLHEKSK